MVEHSRCKLVAHFRKEVFGAGRLWKESADCKGMPRPKVRLALTMFTAHLVRHSPSSRRDERILAAAASGVFAMSSAAITSTAM